MIPRRSFRDGKNRVGEKTFSSDYCTLAMLPSIYSARVSRYLENTLRRGCPYRFIEVSLSSERNTKTLSTAYAVKIYFRKRRRASVRRFSKFAFLRPNFVHRNPPGTTTVARYSQTTFKF